MVSSDDISTFCRSSYSTRDYYRTTFFGRHLDVVVTRSPSEVRSWINKSLYMHRLRLRSHNRRHVIVGLGTQWHPYPYEQNPRPATIQICIGHRILIFQIIHSESTPMALRRLLNDYRITFVGYNIGNDCRLLMSHYGLKVNSTVELRSESGMGNASMEKMVERYLGFSGVDKPRWIGTSDWEDLDLSIDQIQYAALDAYLSFQLGVEFVTKPEMRGVRNAGYRCNAVGYGDESDYCSTDQSDSYSNDSRSRDEDFVY